MMEAGVSQQWQRACGLCAAILHTKKNLKDILSIAARVRQDAGRAAARGYTGANSTTRLSHAPQYHLTKGARESSVHAGKGEKRENGAAVNAEAAGWAGASQMCGQEGGAPGAGRGTARPSGVYAVGRSHCKKEEGAEVAVRERVTQQRARCGAAARRGAARRSAGRTCVLPAGET